MSFLLPLISTQVQLIRVLLLLEPFNGCQKARAYLWLLWISHTFFFLFASQLWEDRHDPRQDDFLPQHCNVNKVSGKSEQNKWWLSLTRQVISCEDKCITRIYAPLFQRDHKNTLISIKWISSLFLCSYFWELRFSEHRPPQKTSAAK